MRPQASWRDALWIVGGLLLAAWAAWQALEGVIAAVGPPAAPGALLVAVVWGVIAGLVGAGAWRRTVWGCPLSHSASGNGARPCPRHPHVADDPIVPDQQPKTGVVQRLRWSRRPLAVTTVGLLVVLFVSVWAWERVADPNAALEVDCEELVEEGELVVCGGPEGTWADPDHEAHQQPSVPKVERVNE